MVELYADFRFQERLVRSWGCCPRHTRCLLVRREAPWVIPAAYRWVLDEAANALARSHGRDPAQAPCPACERVAGAEQGAIRVLLWALAEAEIGRAYRRHGGLCLHHAMSALFEARSEVVAGLLLDVVLERLASSSSDRSLTELAGMDLDAPLRASARRVLAASAGAWRRRSTIGGLEARLRSGACGICLAAGAREADYLEWLAAEIHAGDDRAAGEGRWLCEGHLHDLALLDARSATVVGRHQLEELWHRLRRMRLQLDTVPRRRLGERLRAAVGAWQARPAPVADRVREALRQVAGSRRSALDSLWEPLRSHRCTACRVGTEAEARERALLAAALEDSGLWPRYRRSRGLCARHARQVGAAGPQSALIRETVVGRLRVLGWELEEASRKAAWAARYEPPGPEATAWLRAPGQLDGRVFLGGDPTRVARAWGVPAGES